MLPAFLSPSTPGTGYGEEGGAPGSECEPRERGTREREHRKGRKVRGNRQERKEGTGGVEGREEGWGVEKNRKER